VKVIDLNLLLYAVNTEAPQHEKARLWWESCLSGQEQIGLAWTVVLGFLRISTRPGLFPRPLSTTEAISKVDTWLAQPPVVLLTPGSRHWETLRDLVSVAGTAGNLTTDAHLASLAIEYRAELSSADQDFSRFGPELHYRNPLQ